MKKKTVFIGLSGGVDSAVSAALLQKSGYEVVGVFIKTWHPNFLVCNEEEERHDAMRVAAYLNIPFLTFDFQDIYKKEVADYMISEYRIGKTPNPDVMCNKEVKFGAFFKKAIKMGADYVATGHYAINKNFKNQFLLCKSVDFSKDQSYFLWTLQQEQLKRILFPVGYLKKTEVRILAKKFCLPVAEKKDSQGICFLGDVNLKEFLKHYIKEKRGKVCDKKGKEIGYHNGVVFHTLGERHGFTITKKSSNDKPYYIVDKDVKKNILFVSQRRNLFFENSHKTLLNFDSKSSQSVFMDLPKENFYVGLENINWIFEVPKTNKNYTAQIRYQGEFLSCKMKIESHKNCQRAEIIFKKSVLVASGQSCVLYDGNVCLGGGVVK